jgi:hypothetical protein
VGALLPWHETSVSTRADVARAHQCAAVNSGYLD